VFFLGLAVAALQAATTRAMKVTAAVLSFLSAVIVGYYHQFFPADDRTYDKAARQARHRLEAFIRELAQYPTMDEPTKASLHKEFEQLIKAVEQIEETAIHGAPLVAEQAGLNPGLILLPSAHAQPPPRSPPPPRWALKPPHGDRNLYFVGKANGKTFEEARQNALTDGRNSVREIFKKRAMDSASLAGKPQLIDQVVKALADAAEVADTFTVPDFSAGGYRSWVLLLLPRNAARFTAESIFVQAGVRYDEPFLDGLQR
jgi:hypothetical protein